MKKSESAVAPATKARSSYDEILGQMEEQPKEVELEGPQKVLFAMCRSCLNPRSNTAGYSLFRGEIEFLYGA